MEKLFKPSVSNNLENLIKTEYRLSEDKHGREETRYCQILTNINKEIDPDREWSQGSYF